MAVVVAGTGRGGRVRRLGPRGGRRAGGICLTFFLLLFLLLLLLLVVVVVVWFRLFCLFVLRGFVPR